MLLLFVILALTCLSSANLTVCDRTSIGGIDGVSELRVRLQYRELENVLIQSGISDDASIRKSHYVAYNTEHCRYLCLAAYGEDCGVFSFNLHSKTCRTSTMNFFTNWTTTNREHGTSSFYQYQPDTWKMVYSRPKAIKSANWTNEVSGPWLDDSFYTETMTRRNVFTPVGLATHILNSSVIKFWSHLNVLKVKISIYKGSEEVKYAIFNSIGTSKSSWFSKEKIVSSSWPNLNTGSSGAFWDTRWTRGVYLVQSHGGCPADFVYLVAVENMNVVCNWERFNQAEIPKILYANGTAASNGYDLVEADRLQFSILM